MKIDAKLSWQYHVNDLPIKLNTANPLLFRMRKYVSLKILASIYFGFFFWLLFILLLSILFLLTPIYPTRVLPAFRIVALFNEFYFYKKRLLQFDFVLSLGVMNPLITPVMSIDWMGSIWEVDFDMLKNMDFGNLVDLLSSLRRFDRVYQDWFV